MIGASYDAAQTTDGNSRHWAAADHLSAVAANSPSVRRTVRARSRYECANNPYARGIINTYANDLIGPGPKLQMLTGDGELDTGVERLWSAWCAEATLGPRLRTAVASRIESGEVVLRMKRNDRFDVDIDFELIEADRLTDESYDDAGHDGIVYDAQDRPTAYRILRHHPGDLLGDPGAYVDYPAEQIIHLFRADRPGQTRGMPELSASLRVLSELRRYRMAVLAAAELSAHFAMQIYSDSAGPDETVSEDIVDIEPRMATVMPQGWKLAAVQPTQPTTDHVEHVRSLIIEAARPLSMPGAVALGDSSGYNYASGRLDYQAYDRQLDVDRSTLEITALDRLLRVFLLRAANVYPALSPLADSRMVPHVWMWQRRGHVDPLKEAGAQASRLANRTSTLAREYAQQGLDWESELRQIAREQALMRELNILSGSGEAEAKEDDEEPESARDRERTR